MSDYSRSHNNLIPWLGHFKWLSTSIYIIFFRFLSWLEALDQVRNYGNICVANCRHHIRGYHLSKKENNQFNRGNVFSRQHFVRFRWITFVFHRYIGCISIYTFIPWYHVCIHFPRNFTKLFIPDGIKNN